QRLTIDGFKTGDHDSVMGVRSHIRQLDARTDSVTGLALLSTQSPLHLHPTRQSVSQLPTQRHQWLLLAADGTLFDLDRAEVTGKRVRPVLVALLDEASAGFGLYQLRFIGGDFAFP